MSPTYYGTSQLIRSIYTTGIYRQPDITSSESNRTSETDHATAEPDPTIPIENTVHTTSAMTILALLLVLIIVMCPLIWYFYTKKWAAVHKKHEKAKEVKKSMQAKEEADLEEAKEELRTSTSKGKDASVICISVSVTNLIKKAIYLDQLATEPTMSQNPDLDPYYNEGDSNESIERDNPDGSLRCPVFVQDTDEVMDEDGNMYLCWVDEKAWEEEQKARQIAVLASRYASLSEALAESSEIAPAVENSSTAMPFAITTANMSSVPSAAAETFPITPIVEENVHSQASLVSEPDHSSDYSGEENDSVSLSSAGYYSEAYQDSIKIENDYHYNTEVEDEDETEEEDDSEDDTDDDNDDSIENNTEDEDQDQNEAESGDESDVHSKPEDNEGALNTDTVEATPSISLNNTSIITFYQWIFRIQLEGQSFVEGLTDITWDFISKILFTIGIFVWWIFPEKLRDKLEARHAYYLASGTDILSTVIEQKTRLEEDEDENLTENDAAVPNQGDGMDDLEYTNYWDFLGDLDCLNHVEDYTIEAEEEADYSGGKRKLAYLEDAQGKVFQVLFAMADICDQDLDSISDEYMDRLKEKVVRDARASQIFLQTPIILREWKHDDAYDENGHRIFPDVLPGDDDGENEEEDEDADNGGYDGDDDDDDGQEGEEEEDENEDEEDEDEDEDEDEEDHELLQLLGLPWIMRRRANRVLIDLVLGNLLEIYIPDPWERTFVFFEKCPRDLRISRYTRRRYRGKSGDFRLLLYRG
ncbi:hypothetical protein BOTCAL_0025g00370 [Botryotinia calthae]|uniref:Uncharacterized protein n=1 Tax=Botryotinia calthae TaxID=38488 RepID=A0A4Y8DEG5_9HELO|nr:hypothetical protein BOTCAL_0025g00370 [Botryotinia calthae]